MSSQGHPPVLIYETLHGSRAYGLAREGSDEDRKGIVVGPRAWYFGSRESPEQIEHSADHVHFEIRKLFRLAIANNPTILEILFTEPEDRRTITKEGERLLAGRDRFLSKRVAGTFSGYALSQLKRIQTHRRWLLHPPGKEPTRGDYGLPDRTVMPKDQLGAAQALLEKGELREEDLSAPFLEILDRERRYRSARREWESFVKWKRERNPKRAELEARFGYDTKHAMHLVRLSTMAAEILETGQVRVRRGDREELLAIRDGALGYDALMEKVDALRLRTERALSGSTLPDDPDEGALDGLCVSIVADVLGC
ncbi:MAG: nucleotidyltransferase domain-containing protein [Sandaracinaceae bacterium]|nr:nucleotidyltransferase domain-containing protein [Sandaracinaceae bacterium]